MITTGQANLDAVIAELEATCLGMLESNALKAGEIATLKAEVEELKKKVAGLTSEIESLLKEPPSQDHTLPEGHPAPQDSHPDSQPAQSEGEFLAPSHGSK